RPCSSGAINWRDRCSYRPPHNKYTSGLTFFFSSRRRHTRLQGDWSSDVCSSDLPERQQSSIPERRAVDATFGGGLHGLQREESRSEERRVGKECRSRRESHHKRKINLRRDTN